MLPNWLYGKSKTKLASILGGGGGTPADYNQVKAQVNQNTEDILLLSDQLDDKAALTQISNRNLLDNPWFTINQRGNTTYSGVGYTVDRWKCDSADGEITVSEDGITISNNGTDYVYFKQIFPKGLQSGRYAFSVKALNVSGNSSFHMHYTNGQAGIETQIREGMNTGNTNSVFSIDGFEFKIGAGASITISAVKLELGSISTLAMDTAPDMATELLKCQRYYYRFQNSIRGTCIPGWILNTNARAAVHLPTAMRTTPTINAFGLCPWITSTGAFTASSNLSIESSNNKDITLSQQSVFSDITQNALCVLRIDVGAYIELSADL